MTKLFAKIAGSIVFLTGLASTTPALAERTTAIFAGGCFWCMEKPFDKLDGVIKTTSGYTGGHTKNPTYKAVSSGKSGHVEAVRIIYDPEKIGYLTLLKTFWVNIDPLDEGGQFCDRGSQYRSAIFVATEEEYQLATSTLEQLQKELFPQKKVATHILKAGKFYHAEGYHQDYYKKNPLRYRYYRYGCGRDKRLNTLWEGKTLPF